MTNIDGWLGALLGAPSLPQARCRGRSHLFDPPADKEHPETVSQRHAQALSLCHGCEALPRCETWLLGLPMRQRPFGVVAGRVRKPNPRKAVR